jgi:hypothetical protein
MKRIAHDLNNHIAVLLSFSDLVLDTLPNEHALRSRIEAIRTLGSCAIFSSIPDATRVSEVAEHVAQLRTLSYALLADVMDTRSELYADVFEIATAAETALATVTSPRVRDAA